MHRRPSGASLPLETLVFSLIAFFVFGCDALTLPGGTLRVRPAESANALVGNETVDNDVFDSAQPVALPPSGQIIVDGTIDAQEDIDLYDLGPASAGDRITVDVTGQNGLNTVAALFDANHDLIDANDDRNYYAGALDPYVTQVIRQDQAHLFVGISEPRGSTFSSSAGRYDQGSYSLLITRRPGDPVPSAKQQIVYLNFQGGDLVQIAAQPFETMRPFSAESISPRLSGQTEFIIQRVVALMSEDFASDNVVLIDSRGSPPPADAHTTLYFGNFNQAFLGLSDNVDTGNAYLTQEGIIYTEDFRLFESLQASAEEIAQAIGNTGSHELGHLLGLEHADYPVDIMATAASARQILENNCSFRRSRLDKAVFPAGWQNEPATLLMNVGANSAAGARVISSDDALIRADKADTSWREKEDFHFPMCGSCAAAN